MRARFRSGCSKIYCEIDTHRQQHYAGKKIDTETPGNRTLSYMNDAVHDAQRDENPRHAYLDVACHLRNEQQRNQCEAEYRHFKQVAPVFGGHFYRLAIAKRCGTCGNVNRFGRDAFDMPDTVEQWIERSSMSEVVGN